MSGFIRGLVVLGVLGLAGCAFFSPEDDPGARVFEAQEGTPLAKPEANGTKLFGLHVNSFPQDTFLGLNRAQRKAMGRRLSSTTDAIDPLRPSATVTAIYTEKVRKLPKSRRSFLDRYAEDADDDEVLPLYHHEIEVTEDDRHFWLPVQKDVLAFLKKDLKRGDLVALKVRHLGFHGKEGFFILIDYDKQQTPATVQSID